MNTPSKPTFASFWAGAQIPAFERACMRSFTARGYALSLYSYEPIADLPEGVTPRDASLIAEARFQDAFVVNGKASLSHFTDYFRCNLFGKTDDIWVDVDVLLLKDQFNVPDWSMIAGYETSDSICGAVLRLDRHDPNLQVTLQRIRDMAGKPIVWGATGPRLLTEIYGSALSQKTLPPSAFYPINFNEYYKFLLPEFFEECREACEHATTLHLWNNSIDKAGIWKEIGPPKGSFLHEAYARFGADAYFDKFYPASIMRTMLQNEWFYGGPRAGFKMSTRLVKRNLISAIGRRLGKAESSPWAR